MMRGSSIFGRGKTATIESTDVNAVLNFTIGKENSIVELAVLRTSGSAGPNTQYMQDIKGEIYTVVFGQKMNFHKFVCFTPTNMCSNANLAEPSTIFKRLKESSDNKETIEASMIYNGTEFRGYVHEVDYDSGEIDKNMPFATITILGVMK